MKKITFLALLVSGTLFAQLPYTVEDAEGNMINDGDVIEFSSFEAPDSKYDFFVNNETNDPINVKIEFVSAVNADGSLFELCWGLCYTEITVGGDYPLGNDWVTIDANGQSLPGNHFYNQSDGGGSPIEYVFRFHMVDGAGVDIGEDLTFTYRYDPALGIGDNQLSGVELVSTVVNNQLEVRTQEALTATVYSIQGKVVATGQVAAGGSQIAVGNLASQPYIVVLTNNQGVSKTINWNVERRPKVTAEKFAKLANFEGYGLVYNKADIAYCSLNPLILALSSIKKLRGWHAIHT